jgi:hypothetical protein
VIHELAGRVGNASEPLIEPFLDIDGVIFMIGKFLSAFYSPILLRIADRGRTTELNQLTLG